MKALTSVITAFLENRSSRTNLRALARLLMVLFAMIAVYSVIFHVIMVAEGQDHTWLTGVYWTMTVMTTLGFGDITFHGDAGRFFSILVMISGVVFLLMILPFTFIEFFYAPWMKAQQAARAPRQLPEKTNGHVILTDFNAVTAALVPMLERHGHPYVILMPVASDALELFEQGYKVGVGDLDDPATYWKMRLRNAAVLVAMRSDVLNTNITFTARDLEEDVPIITFASSQQARDVQELAGASLVIRIEEMMGDALARRVIGNDGLAHQIGSAGGLVIAEAAVVSAELIGKTLAASGIRERTGLNVIGVWHNGKLKTLESDYAIRANDLFVLAGTEEQIAAYNSAYSREFSAPAKILIIGGGRVGRRASRALQEAGLVPTIIEKVPERVSDFPEAVVGDATAMETLRAAHAREAATVIITSHDDDLNISLVIFFRQLRANMQIIARCTQERNVRTLHRAGADLVLSSATMGANVIYNMIREDDHLLLAEGVVMFPHELPARLAGKTLKESNIRGETGCTVIAVESDEGHIVNPAAASVLPREGTLLLIGTLDAEERFLTKFPPAKSWREKCCARRPFKELSP